MERPREWDRMMGRHYVLLLLLEMKKASFKTRTTSLLFFGLYRVIMQDICAKHDMVGLFSGCGVFLGCYK